MIIEIKLTILRTLLLTISVLVIPYTYSAPLSFGIDLTEGGRLTKKAITQFESYMKRQGCYLKIEPQVKPTTKSASDFYFSALDPTLNQDEQLFLQDKDRVLTASTLNNEPLTITILIKSSTNIENLSSLKNERLAIISHSAHLGGRQAKRLLAESGVSLDIGKIYETGNYFGALSLLLHGDVFIAAIPGPLARHWKTYNKLSIIAESSAFNLGGVFSKPSLPQAIKSVCIQAFRSIKKEHRRDKKMDVFPSWLARFK
jgi:hypothetical protein